MESTLAACTGASSFVTLQICIHYLWTLDTMSATQHEWNEKLFPYLGILCVYTSINLLCIAPHLMDSIVVISWSLEIDLGDMLCLQCCRPLVH